MRTSREGRRDRHGSRRLFFWGTERALACACWGAQWRRTTCSVSAIGLSRARVIGYACSMPLFDFTCSRCDKTIEVLCEWNDEPPAGEDPCPAGDGTQICVFEKMPSTFTQRWRGDYGNEGRGGWERQHNPGGPDVMIRKSRGRSTEQPG